MPAYKGNPPAGLLTVGCSIIEEGLEKESNAYETILEKCTYGNVFRKEGLKYMKLIMTGRSRNEKIGKLLQIMKVSASCFRHIKDEIYKSFILLRLASISRTG